MAEVTRTQSPREAIARAIPFGLSQQVYVRDIIDDLADAGYLIIRRDDDDWRPIETAPKDGTPILTWAEKEKVFACIIWCCCEGYWRLIEGGDNKPCFEAGEWDGATHWKPITPPKKEPNPETSENAAAVKE